MELTVDPAAGKATARLTDPLTRLVKAEYALDGAAWSPAFPDDGLFDQLEEKLTIALGKLRPGTHVLMVRTTDAAGNIGTADTVFTTTE